MASEAKRVNKIAQEWHVHRRRGLGPEDLIREKGEGHKQKKMVCANLFHTIGFLFNNKNRKSYPCFSLTLDLPI